MHGMVILKNFTLCTHMTYFFVKDLFPDPNARPALFRIHNHKQFTHV